MPSLRDRSDDIPLLVEYFIGRFGKKAGKSSEPSTRKRLDCSNPTNGPATFENCKM
jgi:formate hydrogenlyase transcriptional activator